MRSHTRHLIPAILACSIAYAPYLPAAKAGEPRPWCLNYEVPFESAITADTIELMEGTLGLSEQQVHAIEVQFEAHQREFSAFVDRMKPIKDEFDRAVSHARKEGAAERLIELWLERERRLAPIADQQARLDQQFFEGIVPILAEGQVEQWPDFERCFRRDRLLPLNASFIDEDVDLVRLLEDQSDHLRTDPGSPAVQDRLRTYARMLDEALTQRVKFEIEINRAFYRRNEDRWRVNQHGNVYQDPFVNTEESLREARKLRRLRFRVKQVNREQMQMLAALMPADDRRILASAYMVEAFRSGGPRIALPADLFAQRDVASLDNLSEEQQKDLDALASEQELRIIELNADLLQAADAVTETRFQERPLLPTQRRQLSDDLADAVTARLEAEKSYIDQIWSVLTAEQRSHLQRPRVAVDDDEHSGAETRPDRK